MRDYRWVVAYHPIGSSDLRMWNPFKKKKLFDYRDIPALIFKSPQAAFEYASKYMSIPDTYPALVYGMVTRVYEGMKEPTFDVTLASNEEIILKQGNEVFTSVASQSGLEVRPIGLGDLVSVKLEGYVVPERRAFPLWIIMARVKPHWDMEEDHFVPDLPEGWEKMVSALP